MISLIPEVLGLRIKITVIRHTLSGRGSYVMI